MKTTHLTPALQDNAETQPLRRLLVFLGLAALLTLLAGTALVAHAVVSLNKAAASHACQTTQVTLHGTAAPSFSCLDGQKRRVRTLPGRGSGPLAAHVVFSDACYDDDLDLHWDSNLGGDILCLNGSGVLNLTNVWSYNYFTSWNDQVSSFWTGCYDDYFYTNINQEGGVAWAPGGPGGLDTEWHNFPYGGVPNDTLSSLWQSSSYGGPHCAP